MSSSNETAQAPDKPKPAIAAIPTSQQATTEAPLCDQISNCPCNCDGTDSCLFEQLPDDEILYDLADLFKVFADTTRIKILYSLMGSELCVAHIAEAVGATQSAISHQLRILKQARLVKFKRDGKNVIYSLADNHVFTMLAQGMTHICE